MNERLRQEPLRSRPDESTRTRESDLLLELADLYARALRAQWGDALKAVVLFGSVARREATSTSDVDLLAVIEGLPARRLLRHQWLQAADEAIEPHLQALREQGIYAEVSVILKTPEEAKRTVPLYLDLLEDAVILYEQNGFFTSILERLRESLGRLGARRRRRGRIHYWELKPDYTPGEVFEI